MIPIKDYNPTRRPAIVVPVFVAINIVVFLFVQPTLGASQEEQLRFMYCEAAIPYEITHRENLGDLRSAPDADVAPLAGALERICPDKSVLWSMIASMFFHGGFLHIAGNMLFLWVFGNNIEDRMGRVRFTIFYLLCGIAATLAQSYLNSDSVTPMVGASGAIAGVLGAYLLLYPRAHVRSLVIFFFITVIDLPAVVVLGLWFVLQVFQGVGDVTPNAGVAYFAHIGGFLAGMALLFLFLPGGRRRPPPRYDSPFAT